MNALPGHTCPGIDAAIRATRRAHRASTLLLTLERVRRENAAMRAACAARGVSQ